MGKLFGTDGIRGVANETLDAKLAYRVGQAAAISLADDSGTKPARTRAFPPTCSKARSSRA